MDVNSLKRLIATVVGALVLLAGNKLGLSQGTEAMLTGLLSVFLAQSGVNSALQKVAQSKAAAEVDKAVQFAKQVEGALARAAGQDAAAAGASSASNG